MNLYLKDGDRFLKFEISEKNGELEISAGKKKYTVSLNEMDDNVYSLVLNNRSVTVEATEVDGGWRIVLNQHVYHIPVLSERQKIESEILGSEEDLGAEGGIYAPMPGLVLKIEVSEGQKVRPGQPLLIMEAMKMENEIKAHSAGRVDEILVQEQQKVEKDDLLLRIV